jgi:hypothetical protein
MVWTVETLNDTVDAEVEALPDDMRARLARIAKLIEDKGLEHIGEPHVRHIETPSMGNAAEGPQRSLPSALRDGRRPPRGDRQGICQENGEDAAA